MTTDSLIEALADLEHDQWAHWTEYMLDRLKPVLDLGLNVSNCADLAWNDLTPAGKATVCYHRWREQIATPYAQLSEPEKDSDREWAHKVMAIVGAELAETQFQLGALLGACEILLQRQETLTFECGDCGADREVRAFDPWDFTQFAWAVQNAQGQQRRSPRPWIVCLCGSTRFMDAYQEAFQRLSLEGKVVLTVAFVTHEGSTDPKRADPEQKQRLDELHFRKIDMADEVLILNVGGYIGESTRNEIEYAQAHGKEVSWLEAPAEVGAATP